MVTESAVMFVRLLRFAVLMHHAIEFNARTFRHRVFQLAHLHFQRAQLFEDFERGVHHRTLATKIHVLRKHAVTEPPQTLDLAVVRSFRAHDQTQNSRLAGAIAAHQTDVFSGIDLKSNAAQHRLRAVGFGYFCEAEQHIWGQGDKEARGQGDKEFTSPCPLVSLSPCPSVLILLRLSSWRRGSACSTYGGCW